MMEAMERWWEEKDLGGKERGPERTWTLRTPLVQASCTPASQRWRNRSSMLGGSADPADLTTCRLCDLGKVT